MIVSAAQLWRHHSSPLHGVCVCVCLLSPLHVYRKGVFIWFSAFFFSGAKVPVKRLAGPLTTVNGGVFTTESPTLAGPAAGMSSSDSSDGSSSSSSGGFLSKVRLRQLQAGRKRPRKARGAARIEQPQLHSAAYSARRARAASAGAYSAYRARAASAGDEDGASADEDGAASSRSAYSARGARAAFAGATMLAATAAARILWPQ